MKPNNSDSLLLRRSLGVGAGRKLVASHSPILAGNLAGQVAIVVGPDTAADAGKGDPAEFLAAAFQIRDYKILQTRVRRREGVVDVVGVRDPLHRKPGRIFRLGEP